MNKGKYIFNEQELKDLMHKTWLESKRFYAGKSNIYFYNYFDSEILKK
jgi:hypothetical protein